MQRYYKLRPSRFLTLFFALICAASVACLWMLPLPGTVLFAATAVVMYWGGHGLALDANLRMGSSCVAFRLEDQEEIALVLRDGSHMQGRVSPDSLVTAYFVILSVVLNDQRGKRSLLISPDTMGAESFRHLRVALKWGSSANQGAT